MRKFFVDLDSRCLKPRRFRELDDIYRLIVDDNPVCVHFHDGERLPYRCSLMFYHGELLISARSFEALRTEVYRLYSIRLHTFPSNFSLVFNVYD